MGVNLKILFRYFLKGFKECVKKKKKNHKKTKTTKQAKKP